MTSVRRSLVGVGFSLATLVILAALLFVFRSHLSVATVALVLVVPVVVGVVVGGFLAGAVAVAAGFVVYDVVFIPPYYTLAVGASQNWAALGVYVVVLLLVARVVSHLDRATRDARKREEETRRLLELSQLLVDDEPLGDLLDTIVSSVRQGFSLSSVELFLPNDGRIELVASAGEPLSGEERQKMMAESGGPVALGTRFGWPDGLRTLALSTGGKPVGLLGLKGEVHGRHEGKMLLTFANHIAVTVERARLRDQARRTEVLEEVDRVREALMAAASHDLRTPLATIKMSASALLDPGLDVDDTDRDELLCLIDGQADRLDRLVKNLLDMSRVQEGALQLHREHLTVREVVTEAVHALAPAVPVERMVLDLPSDLPLVDVDPALVREALVNLIDNAARYSPPEALVRVGATSRDAASVEISVTDSGPGISDQDRARVFDMFTRGPSSPGAGLGLSIARAFVEAHRGRIWVARSPSGAGSRVCFTLPTATLTQAAR